MRYINYLCCNQFMWWWVKILVVLCVYCKSLFKFCFVYMALHLNKNESESVDPEVQQIYAKMSTTWCPLLWGHYDLKRINDEILCFAQHWWCQWMGILYFESWMPAYSWYPPWLQYWMPIHYPLWHHRRWAKQKISFYSHTFLQLCCFCILSAWSKFFTGITQIITPPNTPQENKCLFVCLFVFLFILCGLLWMTSSPDCLIGHCIVYLLKSTLKNRECYMFTFLLLSKSNSVLNFTRAHMHLNAYKCSSVHVSFPTYMHMCMQFFSHKFQEIL